jgi:hypothetical protein
MLPSINENSAHSELSTAHRIGAYDGFHDNVLESTTKATRIVLSMLSPFSPPQRNLSSGVLKKTHLTYFLCELGPELTERVVFFHFNPPGAAKTTAGASSAHIGA